MRKRYFLGTGFLIAIGIGLILALINPADLSIPSEEVCDSIDNDLDGTVDEGFATTCKTDSDCGESGPYGSTYCKGDDVYQGWYQADCIGEPGTCESKCQSRQTEKLVKSCSQGCSSGQCR